MTTPQDLDERFRAELSGLTATTEARDPATPVREGTWLIGEQASRLLDAQLASRHLDLAARWLHSFDAGYHTVASSGHEGNAAVAAALNLTDPALLHYRSGAFYCARAAQSPQSDPLRDVLRGLVASAREPLAGGRGKIFGNADLNVVPTTGMLGSHLPRAVGLAWALGQGRRLNAPSGYGHGWPPDAIAVASFGDASINHAAATAAFNTAGWYVRTDQDLPLLLVCEDNAVEGSAASPPGWVEAALTARPGVRYFTADGCDLPATYDAATEAAAWVRRLRRPAVLHLSMVRLLTRAGLDADADADADVGRDPVLATARLLVEAGVLSVEEVLARYDETGWEVRRIAEEVLAEPKLASPTDIIAPLAPRRPGRVSRAIADAAARAADSADRASAFGGTLPEAGGPLTLADSINAALTDAMIAFPQAAVFGSDVVTGGGSGVTHGLRGRFGDARVFDTVPDQTSILGLALGGGLAGLLPLPEFAHLAHLHSAEDQLRGEAATIQYFSQGAYRNPLVLRLAGMATRSGAGGHFANDNALAVLRDVPGVVVAVPARGDDAAAMLRTCLASALVDGSVCVFVEPAALYHARDLHIEGDGGCLTGYAGPGDWVDSAVPIGRARVYPGGPDDDLTIITFGSGVLLSRRAATRLAEEDISCRVVDLRWLSPLPVADIVRESAATGRVLVVDETRRSGGVGEGVLAALVDAGYVGVARRVAAVDSFIPLGPAAEQVLISEDQILQGARSLLGR